MASGAFFQGVKTKPEGQDFRGNERERGSDTDLDSIDSDTALEVHADEVDVWLEHVEPRGAAQDEPLDLQGLVGVAGFAV